MDYRQFNLINSLGETYRLTLTERYGAGFLYDVTGLGSEEETSYQRVGNRFGILTDKINQKTITGAISFSQPRAYESYTKFGLFCQHKPLKLYYRTPAGEFWRDGIISAIEKSENADSLKATVSFEATSLWYRTFEIEGTTSASIMSESATDAGCHITITAGEVMQSPSWNQSLNGTTIVTGVLETKTIDGSVESPKLIAGETLHIRTDTIPYEIYRINQYGTRKDLYPNSKWDTGRFCLIGYGENIISCASASSIKVEGRIEYETI